MSDKTIYLVRHAITRSNKDKVYAGWGEEELLEEGVLQAQRLAREITVLGISAVHTSPVKRALQTARILNARIKAELIVEDDLKEMRMGVWEGLSEQEVEDRYPSEYKVWLQRPADLRMSGRETLHEIQKRGLRAVNRIIQTRSEDVSLLVTHVALIRCLSLHFRKLSLNLYKTISVPNLSLYRIKGFGGTVTFDTQLQLADTGDRFEG